MKTRILTPVLLIALFLFLDGMQNMASAVREIPAGIPVAEKICDSSTHGRVKVTVAMLGEEDALVTYTDSSGKEFFRGTASKACLQKPSALWGLDITLFDADGDGLDDLLLTREITLDAGPQAGMDYNEYSLYENDGSGLVASKYSDTFTPVFKKYFAGKKPQDVVEYVQAYYANPDTPRTPIGQVVEVANERAFMMEPDEKLIFHFRRQKSGKLLTIAMEKTGQYLIYRYGKPGKVELEYKQMKDEDPKFTCRTAQQDGVVRYELTVLEFSRNAVTYRVFDNYIEGDCPSPAGIGIQIIDTANGKTTGLFGDETSRQGELAPLRHLTWINQAEEPVDCRNSSE